MIETVRSRFLSCDMPEADDLTVGIVAHMASRERGAISPPAASGSPHGPVPEASSRAMYSVEDFRRRREWCYGLLLLTLVAQEMSTTAYATPTDDQISWRQADHTHLLPAHLVAFLQGGVTATLGARSATGRPIIGVGVACRVRDMAEVRVLFSRSANLPLIEAVRSGSAIAATFSRARDHRSIQLKAAHASLGEVAPDDHCEAARQSAILADDLVELGFSRAQAEVYAFCNATDLVALAFRPERVFTQTPGPGAGSELQK